MDVADHLWLSQAEQVAIVYQILRRTLEAFPADVRFFHSVGAERRAHRPVNDGDPAFENLFERMWVSLIHLFLMVVQM